MKTCYARKGRIAGRNMNTEIPGVTIQDVPVKVCDKLIRRIPTTPTTTFIQQIARSMEKKKKET